MGLTKLVDLVLFKYKLGQFGGLGFVGFICLLGFDLDYKE